jgi:hypothetical protein
MPGARASCPLSSHPAYPKAVRGIPAAAAVAPHPAGLWHRAAGPGPSRPGGKPIAERISAGGHAFPAAAGRSARPGDLDGGGTAAAEVSGADHPFAPPWVFAHRPKSRRVSLAPMPLTGEPDMLDFLTIAGILGSLAVAGHVGLDWIFRELDIVRQSGYNEPPPLPPPPPPPPDPRRPRDLRNLVWIPKRGRRPTQTNGAASELPYF